MGEKSKTQIEERLGVEALAAMIMNFDNDCIEDYESFVASIDRGDVWFKPKKLEFDLKHRESQPAKPFVEKAPKVELKALPPRLRYVSLGRGYTFSVIIASDLNVHKVESLVDVLKRFKRAIGWTIVDIIGIPPGIRSHKIQIMTDQKQSIEQQRRLNPPM